MKSSTATSLVAAWVMLLAPAIARADILPQGQKGVTNSLAIEGALPPGKALLVANTFYGATRVDPRRPVDVAWHPLSGPMRLFLVDAAVAAKVPAVGGVDGAEERKALAEKGIACSDEFTGTRTLPDTEPADEILLVFLIEATATSCKSKLVRTEFYAKDGKRVAGPDGGPPPVAVEADHSSAPAAPSASEAASSSAPTAPRAGCASCAVGAGVDDAPLAPLAGLALAAAFALRRKSGRFLF